MCDPSYPKALSASPLHIVGVLEARAGQWRAFVVEDHEFPSRNAALVAWCVDTPMPVPRPDIRDIEADPAWGHAPFTAGVDSGQCGVFDNKRYPGGDSTGEYNDPASLYGQACQVSVSGIGHSFGIVSVADGPVGAVCSSGFGDWIYPVFIRPGVGGYIDAVQIVFITDETRAMFRLKTKEGGVREDDQLSHILSLDLLSTILTAPRHGKGGSEDEDAEPEDPDGGGAADER